MRFGHRKECADCKNMLWLFKQGLCRHCWGKRYGKPIKNNHIPIPQQSDTGKERVKKYQIARNLYLQEHPICEFEGCNSKEVQCHHLRGRVGDHMYEDFMAVCDEHHRWIHEHVLEAYKLGYLLSRINKEDDKQTESLPEP